MNIKKSFTIVSATLVLSCILLTIASCTKEGLGGKATINARVTHHQVPVKGSTVYIKFGAVEFPGKDVSTYDASYPTGNTSENVTIKELQKGDYYIYAVGYDSTTKEKVSGGIPVEITKKDETKSV